MNNLVKKIDSVIENLGFIKEIFMMIVLAFYILCRGMFNIYQINNHYSSGNVLNYFLGTVLYVAWFGLGIYFLLTKNKDNTKKYFGITLAISAVNGFLGCFNWISSYMFQNSDFLLNLSEFLNLLSNLTLFVFGFGLLSFIFFKKDIFLNISKIALYVTLFLYVLDFLIQIIIGLKNSTNYTFFGLMFDLYAVLRIILLIFAVSIVFSTNTTFDDNEVVIEEEPEKN